MSILAPLLAFALIPMAPAGSQEPDAPFATVTLAGRKVEVRLPKGAGQGSAHPYVTWNGWNYGVSPDGEVLSRWQSDDEWKDIGVLYKAVQSKIDSTTPVWRVKAFVLTRADELQELPDGTVRQVRVGLESRGTQGALERLALAEIWLEAMSGGAVNVQMDVEVDDEAIRTGSTSPSAFGNWMKSYLSSRLNGGSYESEDKIDRGPWDSVFAVHPLPNLEESLAIDSVGQAAHVHPYFVSSGWPGDGAKIIASQLAADAARQLPRVGYRLGKSVRQPEWSLTPADWGRLGNRRPVDRAEYLRVATSMAKQAKDWSEVKADPLASLPWLETEPAISSARRTVSVPAGLADFYFAHLPEGSNPLAEGIDPDGRIRFSLKSSADLLEDLGLKSKIQPAVASIAAAWGSGRSTENVKWEKLEQGFRYTEDGAVRHGRVYLGGASQTQANRFLTFRARSGGREPLAIHGVSEGKPSQATFGVPPSERAYAFPALTSEWQSFTLDLDALGLRGSDLWIGPPSQTYSRVQVESVVAEFDAFAFSPSGTATPPITAPNPSATGDAPQKLAFLAGYAGKQADDAVARLALDPTSIVQLNAVRILAAKPRPGDLAVLKTLSNNVNFWVGRYALDGLKNLGTEEAKAAIVDQVAIGSFEANRGYAASLIDPKAVDASVPTIVSRLFAARSWQVRRDAVDALARFEGTQSQVILISFLLDPDPWVRLRVVETANPQNELVARRILWTAVNDPSDLVRATALKKLLASNIPALMAEARKGARDEGRIVRLMIVGGLEGEESRGALRQAVADADPEVRALAVRQFVRLDKVTAAEIETALMDLHPAVQRQVVDLLAAKPELKTDAVVARLKASVDPAVAKAAKEKFGG